MKRGLGIILLAMLIIISSGAVAQICDLDPKCLPDYRECGCGGSQTRYTLCEGGCSEWYPCSVPDTESECGDGADNDCDGSIDCVDTDCQTQNFCIDEDNDGYPKTVDCRDTNPDINPGAQEVCNSRDDNCNALIDENIVQSCGSSEIGICRYGTETCINGRFSGCTAILPQTERCDGLDNDCDGQTDEDCACTNGETQNCGIDTGACEYGVQTCSNGVWGACTGGVTPKQELCQNNIDDNCDGQTDEGCNFPDPTPAEIEESRTTITEPEIKSEPIVPTRPCIDMDRDGHGTNCKAGEDCNDADPAIYYGNKETCDNKDNDCNGRTDELLTRSCGENKGACREGKEQCRAGEWTGCDAVFPTEERCNYVDDDCDGETDEGCADNGQENKLQALLNAEFGKGNYDLEQKMRMYEKTKDLIDTKKGSVAADGKTTIKIQLSVKKPLYDVYVYEEIPKTVAKNANEIKFSIQPKIIKADPLVGWHFKEITGDIEIEYEFAGEIKGAHEQTETVSYAESTEKALTYLPLAIIPVVGLMFIVLIKLTKKK